MVQNAFVQDMFVPDGSADRIYEAVVKTVNEKELDCNKLGGVGTDGASVMTGRVNGVVTKMKALEPNIIAVHCVNHRLALASKDSFGQMPVLVNLEETLEALFKYYNYSSKKKGSLEQLQTLLTSEERGRAVTIKHAAHTRWLSHDAAVDSVRKAYDAILVDLESEVVKQTTGEAGAKASGLKKRMMQYNTLACILLLADVLPRLAQLSLHFQKEKYDKVAFEIRNKLHEAENSRMKQREEEARRDEERSKEEKSQLVEERERLRKEVALEEDEAREAFERKREDEEKVRRCGDFKAPRKMRSLARERKRAQRLRRRLKEGKLAGKEAEKAEVKERTQKTVEPTRMEEAEMNPQVE
ncbi:uncharacterized protein LOC135489945 [Lineus longissimus]|uniref:uncharacterized protein LOC135489945 n=1 Tax=Lineus longissimus TaxID=88925 RepID=UPI00315CB029